MFRYLKTRAVPFCAIAFCAVLPQFALAGPGCTHITDGIFSGPAEWAACATAVKQGFAPVPSGGGSFLYVDQGAPGLDNNLYLMYDFVASGPVSPIDAQNSFFDVFFEVVPSGDAYLVRIPGTGPLQAFERPIGSIAPLDPFGSFLLGPGSGWTPLSAGDLLIAGFQGQVGLGPSPDQGAAHLMAEFQLTIERGIPGHPGIYDPAPAFWGASEKTGGVGDPPISSAIFQLNPDGSTLVAPVLGPGNVPLQQGTATPEPGAWMLFASGGLALLAWRKLGRQA